MFLKQSKPEMDDVERKTNFGSKGKVHRKIEFENLKILRKYY